MDRSQAIRRLRDWGAGDLLWSALSEYGEWFFVCQAENGFDVFFVWPSAGGAALSSDVIGGGLPEVLEAYQRRLGDVEARETARD